MKNECRVLLIGGDQAGKELTIQQDHRSNAIVIAGERYSPHSGLVFGRLEGIDGYYFAESEFPAGQMIAVHVQPSG